MTDQIPAEAIEAAARAIQSAHVPVTGEAVPGWESESEAWRKTYRDFARAALEAVDPFLRPEPSEGFATCETCDVTFTGTGTGDRFEVEHVGDRKHRVRALIRVPGPSEDDEKALASVLTAWMGPWLDRKPSLLELILAAGFTRRPAPSRERLIGAIAGSECDWRDATPESIADAVLALFEKGGEG